MSKLMPPLVRSETVKRVVVIGSESTGKTTLAQNLAEHYGTVWSPEFVRLYLDEKPVPLDHTDIEPIARGQIELEDRMAREANRLLILDTDLISTRIYAEHYYGYCPEWIIEAAHDRRADLYLMTDIDVPWVADPQRDRPHLREEMHALFRDSLESRGIPYILIRGNWDERFRTAVNTIDRLLGESGEDGTRNESRVRGTEE